MKTNDELMAILKEDKNAFRTYCQGRKVYRMWRSGKHSSSLLSFTVTVLCQYLMEKLHVPVEKVEELLSESVDGLTAPLRIAQDPHAAFIQLLSEYPTAREFSKASGITECMISLYKSGNRRITIDRMIRVCQKCKRDYVME